MPTVATFKTYDVGQSFSSIGGQRAPYPAVPGIPSDPDVANAVVQSGRGVNDRDLRHDVRQ